MPDTTLWLFALVIVGGGVIAETVSVKFCAGVLPTAFVAVIVKLWSPIVSPAGMVISPVALLIVTPVGGEPPSAKVGAGEPVAVTFGMCRLCWPPR